MTHRGAGLLLLIQQTDGVEQTQHAHAGIRKHGDPHIGMTHQAQDHDDCLDRQGEIHVH